MGIFQIVADFRVTNLLKLPLRRNNSTKGCHPLQQFELHPAFAMRIILE